MAVWVEGRGLGSNPSFNTYKVQVSLRLRFPICTISTPRGVDVRIKRVNNDKGKHVPRPRLFRKASLCAKLELPALDFLWTAARCDWARLLSS